MTKTKMSVWHTLDWSPQEPHLECVEWVGTITLKQLVDFLKYDLKWHPLMLLDRISLAVVGE